MKFRGKLFVGLSPSGFVLKCVCVCVREIEDKVGIRPGQINVIT